MGQVIFLVIIDTPCMSIVCRDSVFVLLYHFVTSKRKKNSILCLIRIRFHDADSGSGSTSRRILDNYLYKTICTGTGKPLLKEKRLVSVDHHKFILQAAKDFCIDKVILLLKFLYLRHNVLDRLLDLITY